MPIVNGEHRWHVSLAYERRALLPERLGAFWMDLVEIGLDCEPGFDPVALYDSAYRELMGDILDGTLSIDAVYGFVRALAVCCRFNRQQILWVQDAFDCVVA